VLSLKKKELARLEDERIYQGGDRILQTENILLSERRRYLGILLGAGTCKGSRGLAPFGSYAIVASMLLIINGKDMNDKLS
jgi:hypothetical protein